MGDPHTPIGGLRPSDRFYSLGMIHGHPTKNESNNLRIVLFGVTGDKCVADWRRIPYGIQTEFKRNSGCFGAF